MQSAKQKPTALSNQYMSNLDQLKQRLARRGTYIESEVNKLLNILSPREAQRLLRHFADELEPLI